MNKSNCESCRSFQSVTTTNVEVEHNRITIETICCACHKHTTTRYETAVVFQQTITDLPKGSFVMPEEDKNQRKFVFDDYPNQDHFSNNEIH